MIESRYRKEMRILIERVEEKIGRPMTEAQKQGLRNIGRFMAFVHFAGGFYAARSNEQIEAWLIKAEKWEPLEKRMQPWLSIPESQYPRSDSNREPSD